MLFLQEESEGEDYEGAGEDSDEDLEEEGEEEEEDEDGNFLFIVKQEKIRTLITFIHHVESPSRGKKRKMDD